MLKVIQNTRISSLVFGSAALLALISATPVTPAAAQGVPAGLLRLDSSQTFNDETRLTDAQQAKVRSAYARVRKHNAH
jgi:Spy/CpxP family protein refolding chaperone